MKKTAPVSYFDRVTGQCCTESVMGDKWLRMAYETQLGRSLWGLLFQHGTCSKMMGAFYNTALSKRCLKSFISIPGLRADEAEKPLSEYKSFNDFFARHLKPGSRPFDPAENILCSPADGRLLVFPDILRTAAIPVKGALRTLEHLCQTALPEERYAVAVVRLAPVDYHRYHFPCRCTQENPPVVVPGTYHSVNPVALVQHPDLFVENTRQITLLNSDVFGTFYQIEVGAFGVGSILQTAHPGSHQKMDEKGYFEFGGSTVILVFSADRLQFDSDLLEHSAHGEETHLLCGDRIARRK